MVIIVQEPEINICLLSHRTCTHPYAIAVYKGPGQLQGLDLVTCHIATIVDGMLEGSLGSDNNALTQSFLK